MVEVSRSEQHYVMFLVVVLGFCMGMAFFFAPIILTQSYLTILSLLIGVAIIYGYFSAHIIHDVEYVTKNHHAGIWTVGLSGTTLGFFIMQERLLSAGFTAIAPASQEIFVLGIAFGVTYLLTYTSFLLLWEEGELS